MTSAALVLALLIAVALVTAIHEAGHVLGVLAKRGRVLLVQVGRGPVGWATAVRDTRVVLAAIPLGGRIGYDGIPVGTGQAVVAVSGAALNLGAAVPAFILGAWVLGAGAVPVDPDSGIVAYAVAATGAWFWVVPGAVAELLTTGSALELRGAVRGLLGLLADRPLAAFPYAVGALSALWAALNLIPVPVLETDGWHIARALLGRDGTERDEAP